MKRVLITRSPHQASELAERLRCLGLEPVLIPTIELVEPSSFAVLDAALHQLAAQGAEPAFHWLIFTSANAVEAFAKRVTARVPDPRGAFIAARVGAPPGMPRIAAIGPATARTLRTIGHEPDIVPPQAVAESLAQSLLPLARQPGGSSTRFLLVRAETARDHLPDALRAAGAEVTIASAYKTIPAPGATAQLQALFAAPDAMPAAITFTSSSTATNLQLLLEVSGLALPREMIRISIGPITSRTLRSINLPPHAEAQEPTVAALAVAVAQALA